MESVISEDVMKMARIWPTLINYQMKTRKTTTSTKLLTSKAFLPVMQNYDCNFSRLHRQRMLQGWEKTTLHICPALFANTLDGGDTMLKLPSQGQPR